MSRSPRVPLRRGALALAVVASTATALLVAPAALAATPPTAPDAPASAASAPLRLDDPAAVIGALAPELLAETRLPATPEQRAQIRAAGGGAAFDARIPADPSQPLRLTPTETDGSGLPAAVTLLDAHGQAATTETGLTTYTTPDAASAAYVQPVADGVRLLTAIADPSAGDAFSYAFDFPPGAYPTELPMGDTILSTADHRYIGSLAAPWARDAAGTALPTHYTWSGSTLTQHVDLTAATAYPVLLDPLWYYSYDYSAPKLPGPVAYPKARDVTVEAMLHNCFNCWFPIPGAPVTYPRETEVLDLHLALWTWFRIASAPVRVQYANGGALQFVALPGHFDGEGSMITFSWYNDPSGYLHLYVHAKVMVDNGPTRNILNAQAACANWAIYFTNIVNHARESGGGV